MRGCVCPTNPRTYEPTNPTENHAAAAEFSRIIVSLRPDPVDTIDTGTPVISSRNPTYCCASRGRFSNLVTPDVGLVQPGSVLYTGWHAFNTFKSAGHSVSRSFPRRYPVHTWISASASSTSSLVSATLSRPLMRAAYRTTT